MARLRASLCRAARSTRAANSARAASSGIGGISVNGRCVRPSNSVLRIVVLEIVTRIGAVERFIAEREVSNDVAFDRGFEQRPLKPRRIAQMTALDTHSFESHPDQHVATKSFSKS